MTTRGLIQTLTQLHPPIPLSASGVVFTQDAYILGYPSPDAAEGWADSLESMIHADPRTRDSIWMGVSLALSCLADPRVVAAVTPDSTRHFSWPSTRSATSPHSRRSPP